MADAITWEEIQDHRTPEERWLDLLETQGELVRVLTEAQKRYLAEEVKHG